MAGCLSLLRARLTVAFMAAILAAFKNEAA
jgi:hypothetical protein